MSRFKILVSVFPLIGFAILTRIDVLPGQGPCLAAGEDTIQIGSDPWRADLHVSFTDDPALATVRVALAQSAEAADFAIVDDGDDLDDGTCAATPAMRFVAIANSGAGRAAVIYLTQDGPADYRVFVNSKTFTARDAAALIVGAYGAPQRLAKASL